MHATLIQGEDHRPLIRFPDGHLGVPVNLRFLSRTQFLAHLGRRVKVLSQLSDRHYTVCLPGLGHQP